MKKTLLVLVSTGVLLGHHSLGNYDITKAVHVKGTVVQFHAINPHSILYLEEKDAGGAVHRWAVEGPSVQQILRTGSSTNILKPGDVVEVCGYAPKEPIMWQVATPDTGKISLAGRLLNGESIVMPDGKQRSWGDYGVHKCFGPEFNDQHSKK